MDDASMQADPEFMFDLSGRVRNLGLPANNINALIPLFEAVSNAVHAIEAKFQDDLSKKGLIEILVHRREDEKETNIVGFTVRDNGVGLTEDNWRSFRTSDSDFKLTKGGKGVGRLCWLKAFSNCQIKSIFRRDGELFRRSFDFSLRSINPIQNHKIEPAPSSEDSGTEVLLNPFEMAFEAHCPKKTSTIAAKLVGHFLPYFVVGRYPRIVLYDSDETVDLGHYYNENQSRNELNIVSLKIDLLFEEQEFNVYHILLRKQLKFLENGLHWIFFSGNDRVTREEVIDSQLGLRYVGDNDDCVYVGLVTSKFLDSHVNQERTAFTFSKDLQAAIHKVAVDSTKEFLSPYIERIRALQVETTDKVIRENPQFLPFRDKLPEFVATNLSLNTQGEEDIYVELSRRKLRLKRRLDGQIRSLQQGAANAVETDVQQVTKALNDEKKSSLAEYVVRRKAILDLFDSSLAFREPAQRKYYKEEVIHELIVPLRANSEDLDYTQHNLWILDDRLAFYTFFRSDQPLRTFAEDVTSDRRPDLAIVFEQSLAFRRDGEDEPIVIVEFKRPARNDYDGNSNPVTQILDYVEALRSSSGLTDKRGRVIKNINNATRFICYIIADFTPSLLKVIKTSPANHPTADGQGYFGVSTPHNAMIEVVPYEKILNDARLRNEAFFRQLGLI